MNTDYQWTGRQDGTTTEHLRIHQIISPVNPQKPGVTLVGFASDEGVARNNGRVGAKEAPNLIRAQLAGLPIHQPTQLYDAGTVACEAHDLEGAHQQLSNAVSGLLAQNHFPIVLGGGHEVAFGSFSGLFDYVQTHQPGQKIGIINFDAHFDLRENDVASSGTPFLQAANLSGQHQQPFHYLCLGVAEHANTAVLFQRADALGCEYVLDHDMTERNLADIQAKIDAFIKQVDVLYVTIDLDVFPYYQAPGVSAPAPLGVDLRLVQTLLKHIVASDKVAVFDVAEYNPKFDQDHHTAKLAAFLIYQVITQVTAQKHK